MLARARGAAGRGEMPAVNASRVPMLNRGESKLSLRMLVASAIDLS